MVIIAVITDGMENIGLGHAMIVSISFSLIRFLSYNEKSNAAPLGPHMNRDPL
jgi:hypothetical protein